MYLNIACHFPKQSIKCHKIGKCWIYDVCKGKAQLSIADNISKKVMKNLESSRFAFKGVLILNFDLCWDQLRSSGQIVTNREVD